MNARDSYEERGGPAPSWHQGLTFCEEGLRASYGALYRPVTGKPVVMEVHGSDGAAKLRRM
jgi:hypothetical protein